MHENCQNINAMKHLSRMEWKRKKNWIRRGKKSQQKERRCGSQKVNFDDETDQPWSLIWSTLESRHQMSEPPYKFLRVINIIAHNAFQLAWRMDKRYFFWQTLPHRGDPIGVTGQKQILVFPPLQPFRHPPFRRGEWKSQQVWFLWSETRCSRGGKKGTE